jgi:hypothetical protein
MRLCKRERGRGAGHGVGRVSREPKPLLRCLSRSELQHAALMFQSLVSNYSKQNLSRRDRETRATDPATLCSVPRIWGPETLLASEQALSGSPTYPSLHLHTATLPASTAHDALVPQAWPAHGSFRWGAGGGGAGQAKKLAAMLVALCAAAHLALLVSPSADIPGTGSCKRGTSLHFAY